MPKFFRYVIRWLAARSWLIIIGIALTLVAFEYLEIQKKNDPIFDPYHITEIVIYLAILALVIVLIDFLIKANAAQKYTMEILDYKHKISMELAQLEDWDMLIGEIVQLPNTIATVEASRLYMVNPISGQLETVARWEAEGSSITSASFHDCQNCLNERKKTGFSFTPCYPGSPASDSAVRSQEYCFPIEYANRLLALIQFGIKDGEELSPEQIEIFDNLKPEMALALRASQEHKRINEMRLAEVSLAERHSISTYLHDNLSQNLAYLCLKLDQYTTGHEPFPVEDEQKDFQRMKEAANQSYDIVRGMIETIHPETTPLFVNLIRAYVKKVSQRSGIEISVKINGKDVSIDPELQQTIFYVFQEALSNVEKHAGAKKAKVLIDWGEDFIIVTVSDDGIGFNPQNIDRTKHFGMEIMQERIDKVDGRIDVNSSPDSGTEIKLSVPILAPQEEEK